jgi:hypothetical protein
LGGEGCRAKAQLALRVGRLQGQHYGHGDYVTGLGVAEQQSSKHREQIRYFVLPELSKRLIKEKWPEHTRIIRRLDYGVVSGCCKTPGFRLRRGVAWRDTRVKSFRKSGAHFLNVATLTAHFCVGGFCAGPMSKVA